MRSIRRRLRDCTWLALLAMLTLALGPTISRLTLPEEPPHGGAFAVQAPMDHAAMHHEAMHHDAMAMAAMHAHRHHAAPMPPSDAPLRGAPSHHHTLEHCALCAVAASAFAVAPSPPVVLAAAIEPRAVAIPRVRGIAP